MKPSAKRALLVGLRGLNADAAARAAGSFQPAACTLLWEADGRRRAFLWACAARERGKSRATNGSRAGAVDLR